MKVARASRAGFPSSRGGYVRIPLEHLREMRPCLHRFVKALYCDEYVIPFTQLAPNSIKWITRFLGCFHLKNYLPTFKLFHHLFKIKRSTSYPLFELLFRKEKCGFPPDASIPLAILNSLRGWHQEFIFILGGGLQFLPLYKNKLRKEHFSVQTLGGDALTKLYGFCGALARQWNRDSFFDNSTLHAIGYKQIFFLLFH